MKTTIIDVLRHGEPEGGQMYRGGGTDHHLCKSGWSQMQTSVSKRHADAEDNWEGIISSPMLRCKEFAQTLAKKRDIPISIYESFREASYGDWEGRTSAKIIEASEKEYWDFFKDPVNCRPVNSEPLDNFTSRIDTAFTTVLHENEGKHVLLIAHLGVTRAIINKVLGMPLASQQRIDMPFAGMIRIINDRKGFRLLLF